MAGDPRARSDARGSEYGKNEAEFGADAVGREEANVLKLGCANASAGFEGKIDPNGTMP